MRTKAASNKYRSKADGAACSDSLASYRADAVVNRPPKCGIYYLFDDAENMVYVGQSTRVIQRLATHNHHWTKALVREVPPQVLNVAESVEIRRYLPALNGDFGPAGKLAGQLHRWFGELPTIDSILENKYTFGALCLMYSEGGCLWMDEDGHVAARWPQDSNKTYAMTGWTDCKSAVEWVQTMVNPKNHREAR